MKSKIAIIGIIVGMFSSYSFSQDLTPSQVPSLVTNKFKQSFPNATDVEWEMKGALYNVEFEEGNSNDQEAWFDGTGKMIKHKTEIAGKMLPEAVKVTIKKDFSEYAIDDAVKITSNGVVTYRVELENSTQEWKVTFDTNGKVLEKKKD
ncbi:MAG: PepSY-like domain-containing protein [Crocinitomicaceae bacterium]